MSSMYMKVSKYETLFFEDFHCKNYLYLKSFKPQKKFLKQ